MYLCEIHGADAAPAVCWTSEVFALNGKKRPHQRLDKVLTEQVQEGDKSNVGELRVGCKTVCRVPFLIYHATCGKEISGDSLGVAVTEAVGAALHRFFFRVMQQCYTRTRVLHNKGRIQIL